MIIQSCFDIKVIVNELNSIVNSRIEKFYNTSDGELLIKGYSAIKGKYIFLIQKEHENNYQISDLLKKDFLQLLTT